MSSPPVYFEESWAILSSIGIINVLFGFMIIGITTLSPLSSIPIVVSTAGAIANGLCYYAFYADYSKTPTVAAAAVADVAWLIQEAGMSFYSYMILSRVLKQQSRVIFRALFWALMLIIVTIRAGILINRAREIINPLLNLQTIIDGLHIGYFSSIATIECMSAFFLLRKFAHAKRTSLEAASKSQLFSYLMKSTEIRLAFLAVIGTTRAITYSFQNAAQAATSVAGQVDRFVYTMECLFPVMMFIDILGSKIVVINHIHSSSSQTPHSRSLGINPTFTHSHRTRRTVNGTVDEGDIGLYPMNNVETRVDAKGAVSSSMERIVGLDGREEGREESSDGGRGSPTLGSGERGGERGGINKTVEFEFHVGKV